MWTKGTIGRLYTQHRCDGKYNVLAELTHDSPPNQETIQLKLLGDFYCCEAGEIVESQRYLFVPGTT